MMQIGILILEDIDSTGDNISERENKRDDDDNYKASLSEILNFFDGLETPEGLMCFFTTNYIDKLDKAFLRDGGWYFTAI